jgi:hypothetical protein
MRTAKIQCEACGRDAHVGYPPIKHSRDARLATPSASSFFARAWSSQG